MSENKQNLGPADWAGVEETVNNAEKRKRRAARAGRAIYGQTGQSFSNRVAASRAGEDINRPEKASRILKQAKQIEATEIAKVDEQLGTPESAERRLVGFRMRGLVRALRQDKELDAKEKVLIAEKVDVLKGVQDVPNGPELAALDEIQTELAALDKERKELIESSPEAYFGLHLRDLKQYKKESLAGRIVETPYVQAQAEDIAAHLRANKPVLIYGHLGSGKTELAMHVARNYILKDRVEAEKQQWLSESESPTKESSLDDRKKAFKEIEDRHSALVISGSKHTSLAELYGHQILTVDKESGSTVTDYFLGPVYRAMEEGRPVIIDEVNAIPHEVLISLNHILTRLPGDVVNVQQDSGKQIVIKEGFCILMTGNLNQGQTTYIDRQDMDPAFLSRLYKKEYDYLPQAVDGNLKTPTDVRIADKDEAEKSAAHYEKSELFHLLLARFMDKNGNIEAPAGTLNKLWDLAKAARLIQDIFSGKDIDKSYYPTEAGGRALRPQLKEVVLSLRALDAVIGQWQKEGYTKELDYYLWQEFVAQSTVPADRDTLYRILKGRFGFFAEDAGWPPISTASSGNIRSFSIEAPKNKAGAMEFLGPREVITAAFGQAPERAAWPDVEKDPDQVEKNIKLQEFKEKLEAEILPGLAAGVERICSDTAT